MLINIPFRKAFSLCFFLFLFCQKSCYLRFIDALASSRGIFAKLISRRPTPNNYLDSTDDKATNVSQILRICILVTAIFAPILCETDRDRTRLSVAESHLVRSAGDGFREIRARRRSSQRRTEGLDSQPPRNENTVDPEQSVRFDHRRN